MPAFTTETAKKARKERVYYPALTAKQPDLPADPYAARTLARTRKQLRLLYRMLASETDPAKIDRLASAIEKLSRIEQNLAGRPGPGQYRPDKTPATKAKPALPEPVDPS